MFSVLCCFMVGSLFVDRFVAPCLGVSARVSESLPTDETAVSSRNIRFGTIMEKCDIMRSRREQIDSEEKRILLFVDVG